MNYYRPTVIFCLNEALKCHIKSLIGSNRYDHLLKWVYMLANKGGVSPGDFLYQPSMPFISWVSGIILFIR